MIYKLCIVDDPENLAYIDCTIKFYEDEKASLSQNPLETVTLKLPITEEINIKKLFTILDKIKPKPDAGALDIVVRKLEEAGFSSATEVELNKSDIDSWMCFDVSSLTFDSIVDDALGVGLKMKYYCFKVDVDNVMLILFEDLS